ncbi:MAG TPA: XdhC family protein [Tepidisphaeraceae bacterium]|jgi:xanthine dehydrogenase accessory factor|nr:XdhC family protein [Tepidisphaeraceae bacterium]
MATHAIVNDIYQKVAEFLLEDKKFALAVVMKDAGSTPRKAGTKAIIDEAGSIWGTIGGGLLESDARKLAIDAIESGKPKVFDFKFSGTCAAEDDPVCGGNMRILIDPTADENADNYIKIAEAITDRRRAVVLRLSRDEPACSVAKLVTPELSIDECHALGAAIRRVAAGGGAEYLKAEGHWDEVLVEPIAPSPRLLISGGGHVGQALARQAQLVGFEVVVIEDREEFANPELFPPGIKCRRAPFKEALFEFPIDPDTYIALVGRGHKVDSKALLSCLNSPAAYIGMMGSRRKVALVKKEFIDSMLIDEAGWNKIHAPIGLDIGADTVAEIAASIVAQLIAVRRNRESSRTE